MDITLEDARKTIEDERDYVDRKPYSHNIISLTLQTVAENFGQSVANDIIDEYDLEPLGWNKIGDVIREQKYLTITVSGIAGSGKTGLATLLKSQLETFGLNVQYEDPDGRELPCTNTVKKRIKQIIDKDMIIDIQEKSTHRENS